MASTPPRPRSSSPESDSSELLGDALVCARRAYTGLMDSERAGRWEFEAGGGRWAECDAVAAPALELALALELARLQRGGAGGAAAPVVVLAAGAAYAMDVGRMTQTRLGPGSSPQVP